MAYDNSGTLGRNKYKKTESQPEYTGTATIGGVDYRIAGWVKEGKDGKFFGLKFSIPQPKGEISAASSKPALDDDEIPF